MKKFTFLILAFMLLAACDQSIDTVQPSAGDNSWVLVADDIKYDVILRPANEFDAWEIERLQGYNGAGMVNTIFNSVYSGKSKAFDYHSGEKLSVKDIKKIEAEPGFVRENLGKLQFTETWYFNPSTLEIEKEVKAIVLGYELHSSEGLLTGYKAAFKIEISK